MHPVALWTLHDSLSPLPFSAPPLQKGADVFNCLSLMENGPVLRDLKFGPGDGSLQYYLYNWQCPAVPSEAVGLVLL
jgi:hypothetical protein